MGRVDEGADLLGREIGGQALGAAEAANALRDRRSGRIGGRARKRENARNVALTSDAARERACFRRAAENEQTKAVQRAAP